ncbi:NAD(P)H-dependent oxidoreductase [Enterococcus ratti]|nr:NAD(P)H-dependent oxidoreductase [Enterococcus ratti]
MKSLIIVSHPSIETSLNQQFFKEATRRLDVTWHHLEKCYPDGEIALEKEIELLKTHDRIIFQFPFYWYSAPAHLKIWQDAVLIYATECLRKKELGIVLTTGVSEKEYQAGGKEEYTISEFLRPYQRIAHKFDMTFLPPFVMAQFMYQTEEKKWERLIAYQRYLTLTGKPTLVNRIDWFLEQLRNHPLLQASNQLKQEYVIDYLCKEKEALEDLMFTLQELKE